jgi:hypothetical protein
LFSLDLHSFLPASFRGVILDRMSDVTRILSAIEQDDPSVAEQLLPLVYDEFRKLAAQRLAQEKPGQTLQATALVHEAYLRLVDTPTPVRGTAAATSSPPPPRPCAASSSKMPVGRRQRSTAVTGNDSTSRMWRSSPLMIPSAGCCWTTL